MPNAVYELKKRRVLNIRSALEASIKDWLDKQVFQLPPTGRESRYWVADEATEVTTSSLRSALCYKWGLDWDASKKYVESHRNFLMEETKYLIGCSNHVVRVGSLLYRNKWQSYPFQLDVTKDKEAILEEAKPFIKHLEIMVGDLDGVWGLTQLLARKIQMIEPRKKMPWAIYLYGGQGSGKTAFGILLEKLFGEEAVMSSADINDFNSKSSVELWQREWLHIDEIPITAGSKQYNTIKSFTGTDSVNADKKYQDFNRHPVPANLVMTSNHAPSFLEPDDRRFIVLNWDCEFETAKAKADYMTKFHEWALSDAGLQAITNYLWAIDVEVTVADHAPMTDAKRRALGLSGDRAEDAVADALDNVIAITLEDRKSVV